MVLRWAILSLLDSISENWALQPFADGRYIVGSGEIWLVSSYSPRSFDSRYFGPVKVGRVVATVRPVLHVR
jgi:type IV secretory pathway protease TraF